MQKNGFVYKHDKWSWSLDGLIEAKRQKHKHVENFRSGKIPYRVFLNTDFQYPYREDETFDLTI